MMSLNSRPPKWFPDVAPFVVVRHYAKHYVRDEMIKAVLQQHSITTLDELDAKFMHVMQLLANYQDCGFAIHCATRNRGTAEEALGGLVEYEEEDGRLVTDSYDTYSPDAVSVMPNEVANPTFNFSLVFGPSGSGKTLFCLRRLYQLVFPNALNEMEVLRIHVTASKVLEHMEEAEEEAETDFLGAVAAVVQTPIKRRLSVRTAGNVKRANLYLHVIIDEAGLESYKDYFDTAAKIQNIVTALDEKLPLKFEKGIHVTVTGVGLQITTAEINSVTETTKFQMQHMTVDHFDALVDKSSHFLNEKVKATVRRHPIFQSLLANGRCANFLRNFIQEVLSEERLDDFQIFVDYIVSKVSEHYICSNKLFGMVKVSFGSNAFNWELARAVYKELDSSRSQPNVAFFPQYHGLDCEWSRSLAACLLDLNVESRGGNPILETGCVYSMSMQPALKIALAAALHCDHFEIQSDWQSFESTVMLMELKHMVAHFTDLPNARERTLIEMRSPVPVVNDAGDGFTIPYVNRFTVLRIDQKSSYANIVSPFRLVQIHLSEGVSTHQTLDLAKELNEMGLTTNLQFRVQQAATSAFYNMWKSTRKVPLGPKLRSKKRTYQVAKFSSVETRQSYEEPTTVAFCRKKWKKDAWAVKSISQVDPDVKGKVNLQVATLVGFEESLPVTAVFVTNCKTFVLARLKGMDPFFVHENDVDWQGQLTEKELPADLLVDLRPNVQFRFLFV